MTKQELTEMIDSYCNEQKATCNKDCKTCLIDVLYQVHVQLETEVEALSAMINILTGALKEKEND